MCSEVGADDFSDGDSFDTGASTASAAAGGRSWLCCCANLSQCDPLTSSLYRVEPSDGVHVTAKANAVYSHLLATHLLRTVLPRRAVD